MITVAGEALIDMIADADGRLVPKSGGGPFNVARAVARAAEAQEQWRRAEANLQRMHDAILGYLHYSNDRLREAEEGYRQALDFQKELVEQFPTNREYRELLAHYEKMLARVLGRLPDLQPRQQPGAAALGYGEAQPMPYTALAFSRKIWRR